MKTLIKKFNPIVGIKYQVLNSKFLSDTGMISSCSIHEFEKSYSCYDARFHGVGDPADYICYQFKLPKQFGIVSFYQFQIKELLQIN